MVTCCARIFVPVKVSLTTTQAFHLPYDAFTLLDRIEVLVWT
jgi:hypothetical protein